MAGGLRIRVNTWHTPVKFQCKEHSEVIPAKKVGPVGSAGGEKGC